MNACHDCIGLSSFPALHSFGHLNMFLAKRLFLCVDCFELTFVWFCNILFYKIESYGVIVEVLENNDSIKNILEVAVQVVLDLQEQANRNSKVQANWKP